MGIAPALLEDWMRDYYYDAEIDIGSSGVQSFSFAELTALTGLKHEMLDQVVFDDGHSCGSLGLRQAIARRWSTGDVERVMTTHGSSEAIYLVMNALLRPGDEVLVLDPCYHSLYMLAESIGCHLKRWRLPEQRLFMPDIADGLRLIGPQTRMIVVNFPHNPTGRSISAEELALLEQAAAAVGAYLVWDAAFAELTYEPPLPDPTLHYERAISIGTLSKAFGLPGLRVGWCIASPEVLAACIHLRDFITLHIAPFVELIAQHAVEHADQLIAIRREQARANLELLTTWAAQHEASVEWYRPQGGVTCFPRLRGIDNTEAFCRELAARYRTLLVPGTCFNHPQHVRLGFGGPTAALRQGLDRLQALLHEHGAADAPAPRPARREDS